MKKPQALRAYLLQSNPHLTSNPDCLQIYINTGTISCRPQTSLHYQYEYTLNVIVTDLSSHPDCIIAPLLAWVRTHQIDLPPTAIQFEADIIDNNKIDLSITLPLSEGVLVNTTDATHYSAIHIDEPQPEYLLPDPSLFKALYADGFLMTRGYADSASDIESGNG